MSMDAPRVLVLGAGSIGSRHARNLLRAGAVVDVMDLDRARAAAIVGTAARPLDLERLHGYDGIVVATPTSLHAEHGSAALSSGARVLIEKPLAATSHDAHELAALGSEKLAVGYNLRFHEPTRRAIDLILDGAVGRLSSVRLWFGSWLPDWRPGTDYRAGYSARRDLGGGVLLDAIHELDLALWATETQHLEVVGAVVDRLGPLEIDAEDTVKAVLRTATGTTVVELSLDYLARRYRRGLEATGATGTIRLDWARRVIEVEDGDGSRVEQADVPIDRSYEAQDTAFVEWLRGGPPLPVDGTAGVASVALAEAIRAAAT